MRAWNSHANTTKESGRDQDELDYLTHSGAGWPAWYDEPDDLVDVLIGFCYLAGLGMNRGLEANRPQIERIRRIRTDQIRVNSSNPYQGLFTRFGRLNTDLGLLIISDVRNRQLQATVVSRISFG